MNAYYAYYACMHNMHACMHNMHAFYAPYACTICMHAYAYMHNMHAYACIVCLHNIACMHNMHTQYAERAESPKLGRGSEPHRRSSLRTASTPPFRSDRRPGGRTVDPKPLSSTDIQRSRRDAAAGNVRPLWNLCLPFLGNCLLNID